MFACSDEDVDEDVKQPAEKSVDRETEEGGKKKEGSDEEEEGAQSSDDSYVKIITFADGPGGGEDLGTDLGEFVKEVKLAPNDLRSFRSEPVDDISKQVRKMVGVRPV